MKKSMKDSVTPVTPSERLSYNEGNTRITSTKGAEAEAKALHEHRALKSASEDMRGDYSAASQDGYAKGQFEAVKGEERMSPYVRDLLRARSRYQQVRSIKRSLEATKSRDR